MGRRFRWDTDQWFSALVGLAFGSNNVLFSGCHFIVGYLATSVFLVWQQKCLQALPAVPWEVKLLMVDNKWPDKSRGEPELEQKQKISRRDGGRRWLISWENQRAQGIEDALKFCVCFMNTPGAGDNEYGKAFFFLFFKFTSAKFLGADNCHLLFKYP